MLTFTPSPDRFVVEEIPAYAPSGEGTHTFVWLEKQGLTTFDAIALVAKAFGLSSRDVGYAGLKDKQATTRQWLSLPGLDPERALAFAAGGRPHPHGDAPRAQAAPRAPARQPLRDGAGGRRDRRRGRGAARPFRGPQRARRPQPLRRAAFRHGRRQRRARPRPAARRAPGARQAQAQAAAVRAAVGGVQPHARAAGNPGRADRRPSGGRAQEDGDGRAVRRRRSPRSTSSAWTRAS